MQLDEYQKQAMTTDLLGNGSASCVTEPAYIAKILGLVGEAGEVAEKYKKIIRDKNGIVSEEEKHELIKELGDVLWYIAALAKYLDTPLEAVAQANIHKLQNRKRNGTQRGSGDNR